MHSVCLASPGIGSAAAGPAVSGQGLEFRVYRGWDSGSRGRCGFEP